jgi:hypothetical protein
VAETTRYRIVRKRERPHPALWLVGLILAAAIIVLWPSSEPAVGFRPLCEAQGGIVVRTTEGRLCLWAGAVIPVRP